MGTREIIELDTTREQAADYVNQVATSLKRAKERLVEEEQKGKEKIVEQEQEQEQQQEQEEKERVRETVDRSLDRAPDLTTIVNAMRDQLNTRSVIVPIKGSFPNDPRTGRIGIQELPFDRSQLLPVPAHIIQSKSRVYGIQSDALLVLAQTLDFPVYTPKLALLLSGQTNYTCMRWSDLIFYYMHVYQVCADSFDIAPTRDDQMFYLDMHAQWRSLTDQRLATELKIARSKYPMRFSSAKHQLRYLNAISGACLQYAFELLFCYEITIMRFFGQAPLLVPDTLSMLVDLDDRDTEHDESPPSTIPEMLSRLATLQRPLTRAWSVAEEWARNREFRALVQARSSLKDTADVLKLALLAEEQEQEQDQDQEKEQEKEQEQEGEEAADLLRYNHQDDTTRFDYPTEADLRAIREAVHPPDGTASTLTSTQIATCEKYLSVASAFLRERDNLVPNDMRERLEALLPFARGDAKGIPQRFRGELRSIPRVPSREHPSADCIKQTKQKNSTLHSTREAQMKEDAEMSCGGDIDKSSEKRQKRTLLLKKDLHGQCVSLLTNGAKRNAVRNWNEFIVPNLKSDACLSLVTTDDELEDENLSPDAVSIRFPYWTYRDAWKLSEWIEHSDETINAKDYLSQLMEKVVKGRAGDPPPYMRVSPEKSELEVLAETQANLGIAVKFGFDVPDGLEWEPMHRQEQQKQQQQQQQQKEQQQEKHE